MSYCWKITTKINKIMKRYSNKEGMMIENPDGGWAQFADVQGTDQEIKDWMKRYAVHANYPDCLIRKTKECTCGLNDFITPA